MNTEEKMEEQEALEEQQWHHVAKVENLGDLRRRINVTYDAEAVKMAMDKATDLVGKKTAVKGFRRGKAPGRLVRAFCSKEIEATAKTMLTQEGYLHALFENKLQSLTEPDVDRAEFNRDGTFECSIEVDVRPKIELSGYVGLALTEPDFDTEGVEVRLIEELRGRFSETEERDEVQVGRTAIIDFETRVGDEVVISQEGQPFMIRSGQPLPFGENLCGLKVGEEIDERITLPGDFKKHGGKEAVVSITVRKVTEQVPATDEQLVERTGLESFNEIAAQVREQAVLLKDQNARQYLEEQAVDALLEMHDFEVPKKWIDKEQKYISSQLGFSGTDAETEEELKNMALRNVRRAFIMDALQDAEPSLAATKEELDDLIRTEAKRLKTPAVKLRKQLQAQGRLDEVLTTIRNKKMMDFLLASARIESPAQQQDGQDSGAEEVTHVEFEPMPIEEE